MKRIWVLTVTVLLSASVIQGQTTFKTIKVSGSVASNLPLSNASMPSAPSSSSSAKAEPASAEALPVAPSMLVRPIETPKVADKKFWMINVLDVAWTVADIETTVSNLNSSPYCREMNPLVGPRPSRTTLYLSNIPVMVGAGYLSYRSHKKQSKRWYMLPSIAGGAHAAGALWNVAGSNCR